MPEKIKKKKVRKKATNKKKVSKRKRQKKQTLKKTAGKKQDTGKVNNGKTPAEPPKPPESYLPVLLEEAILPAPEEVEILDKPTVRRITWETNQAIIEEAYFMRLSQTKRKPTIREMAKITGLSPLTVHRHLATLTKETIKAFHSPVLIDRVITKMALLAVDGDKAAARIYLEFADVLTPADTNPQEPDYRDEPEADKEFMGKSWQDKLTELDEIARGN